MRPRYAHDPHDSTRQVGFGCLLAVCAVLVASGIFLIATASHDHARTDMLDQLSTSLGMWNASERAAFAAIEGVHVVLNGTRWPLARDDAVLPLVPSADPDVPVFGALAFEADSAPLGALPWSEEASWAVGFDVTEVEGGAVTRLELDHPIALARRVRVYATQKSCSVGARPGMWVHDNARCYGFEVLAEICVKVRPEGASGWALDATGGGVGCYEHEGWSAARYTRVRGERRAGGRYSEPAEMDLAGLRVQLRSASDPLIQARNATHDTLVLPTPPRLRAAGGLELLVIGLVLATPALCFFGERRWGQPACIEDDSRHGVSPETAAPPPAESEAEVYAHLRGLPRGRRAAVHDEVELHTAREA